MTPFQWPIMTLRCICRNPETFFLSQASPVRRTYSQIGGKRCITQARKTDTPAWRMMADTSFSLELEVSPSIISIHLMVRLWSFVSQRSRGTLRTYHTLSGRSTSLYPETGLPSKPQIHLAKFRISVPTQSLKMHA
jgi:hypothetical protein